MRNTVATIIGGVIFGVSSVILGAPVVVGVIVAALSVLGFFALVAS